jgi:pyrophosphatase PpaX
VRNGSPEAVLFDFDGTLVDTTELIYNSLLGATNDVLGREFSREELLSGVGRPLPKQMEALVGEDPQRTVLVERLMESYREHNERLHEDLISAFPGVEAALARLHDAGVRTAVVTSKRRRSVEMALDSFPGLRNVTDVFVTMEDTERHKPDPEPLLKGLELLGGIPTERAAYVGDSPHDVRAARDAGVTSVAVSWGAFSEEALRRAGPDHLVDDIDAVVDVLLGKNPR